MYISDVDELFDTILNKLNNHIFNNKLFDLLLKDTNFVKFQNEILLNIKNFIDSLSKKDIINIIKKESSFEYIINIIKRYCAFYIYLGIAYYYDSGRELFITNIIEISRYQKDAKYQIPNFFNSENNSKIIKYFNDIKNILGLLKLKTVDKIKIVLSNNILKYDSTIKLFEDFGGIDNIIDFFLIEDNFHNIIKSIILKLIYFKEDKKDIMTIINEINNVEGEYKYIDIIVSNEKKIIDFNIIQKFLNIQQLKIGLAEEIYNYLEENKKRKEIIIKENQDYINYLFSNEIIIPITEDFLRYHKDSEKYDTEKLVESENIKDRDATKIKYILTKMNNVRNYYSKLFDTKDTNYFYKPQDPKMAVLFNENEEIKIIQKLELLDTITDYDSLLDLENIRKYSYVNFKNFSKEGIKIRPLRTIEGIRYTNLSEQSKKKIIEIRIGNDGIDMNIVGIGFNPSKIPLDCFHIDDLIDVKKITNDKNGYNAFNKTMIKTFFNSSKKIYFWLFDKNTDKPKLNSYIDYNINDEQNIIKIMLEGIYNNYIKLAKEKIFKYLDNTKEFDLLKMNKLINNKKLFDFSLNPQINNEIIEKIIFEKYPEYEIIPDDIDSIIPGKRDKLIILPIIDYNKYIKNNIIILNQLKVIGKIDIINNNLPLCLHYIKWRNINKISKKSDDFNQAIFEFVKQYVKLGDHDEYLCKSCNEILQIKKYVFEGTFIEELDTFLTTSMAVNLKLEELPKYYKYIRTIRNIEKNIEKFAYSINLNNLIGNTAVVKLRRKMLIKDIIDLVLINTDWLRKAVKDRMEQNNKKYGITLSKLFFFDLKDEIFLTSSTDIDQFKIIKFNNIMIYLLLVIVMDLNVGQILNFRPDKKFNYYIFQKINDTIFNNLYLRLNQKEKIQLTKLPVFSYVIYYLSGIMIANKLWLYDDSNIETKNKQAYLTQQQIIIIHTFIDLFNSLVEANMEENKNYLYEIINTRLNIKLNNIYNDPELLKKIQENTLNNITIDEKSNTINLIKKNIDYINLNTDFNIIEKINPICDLTVNKLNKTPFQKDQNNIDLLTNCDDGKFHNWNFKNNDLICDLCKKSYNELVKLINTSSENQEINYLNKIKFINLKKLSKKYCISGIIHEINPDGICNKCKININNYDPTNKELKLLEKNIEIKTNEVIIDNINKIKKIHDSELNEKLKTKNILIKLIKKYEKITKNKLESYIDFFIDKLIKIVGHKLKINENIIYLKETTYLINHDYLGYSIKTPIFLTASENKIILVNKHPLFNKDILYYIDKSNKVYVYYDFITLQYLGYSTDNKNIKKTKNNAALIINLSIKDCILLLGYENQHYNLYHINKEYLKKIPNELLNNNFDLTKDIILNILRNRINNLRQLIIRSQSIIYNILNSGKITSIYNIDEKNIVNQFTKKLKNFNIKDNDNHNIFFKHSKYIINNLPINYKLPNFKLNINLNYIDISNFISLNNNDCKLIFYMIYNFNKLLDYNTQPAIVSELAQLIIYIIKYQFGVYYRQYSNYNIRKFDFLIINETPYVDEKLKVSGNYMELLTQHEIDDDQIKEENYTNKEEKNSYDMDDFELNDDIDEAGEILDNDFDRVGDD